MQAIVAALNGHGLRPAHQFNLAAQQLTEPPPALPAGAVATGFGLHTIVGWREMVCQMTSRHLTQKLARISPMMTQDAATRYLEFMENYYFSFSESPPGKGK